MNRRSFLKALGLATAAPLTFSQILSQAFSNQQPRQSDAVPELEVDEEVSFSGNYTPYIIYIDGSPESKQQTYWGSPLHTKFEYDGYSQNGLLIPEGKQIEVKTIHCRPDSADFYSRIQLLEIG